VHFIPMHVLVAPVSSKFELPQDDNAKVMAFRLRTPGFMRKFEGFWRMEPYPGQPQVCGRQSSGICRGSLGSHSCRICRSPLWQALCLGAVSTQLQLDGCLHSAAKGMCVQATLAVLHQNVLPCVSAPGLNWVITKICRAQIEAMLEDVKKEVSRIRNGAQMHAIPLVKLNIRSLHWGLQTG
jgi:hypothetical protein